ncbi:ABC transporter [Platysternon megacephalum]|uniref:ABC transporter n=1 Tax=Platysternon megacephalum TaxID=55544 RepID=A0A4D9DI28_9SAUR|nr:ABC transporter [Platysternon megacephalum]
MGTIHRARGSQPGCVGPREPGNCPSLPSSLVRELVSFHCCSGTGLLLLGLCHGSSLGCEPRPAPYQQSASPQSQRAVSYQRVFVLGLQPLLSAWERDRLQEGTPRAACVVNLKQPVPLCWE